ncbi:DUF938 domain-containing protein [Parasphingorhabdus halotolerans]|uniref:DUF938 domain-containing protein n=1 Tax=Parasphingorhabdus halotolerans TaxID=2725558 RepID=A0A6H2DLD0_9SPHN|nr:DUF938 domain-containing protein [Parasphingorhabdus halotolerans]QJB69008.1 DUF938 domain-containing protein [Parasphingorhabdus halotolerans]
MNDSKRWLTAETRPEDEKHAPATLRNRDAIVAVLADVLPGNGTVLEVASGTGEHAVYFGEKFPHLTFQPSDPDPDCCRSIASWTKRAEVDNLLPPLQLNALARDWNVDSPAAILCINMIHIAPWEAAIGLFNHAAKLLEPGALFYLYGPYFRDEVEPAQGNLEFERSLKSRNLQWGIRDVADMDKLAAKTDFERESLIEMPANNISLVYRKA